MVILSYRAIREFIDVYPDAADALITWYNITENADWANLNQVKQVYGSCDYVGNGLYVFNIRGNHYRLIARISFRVRTVYIKFIGTHAEYDRVDMEEL